MDILDAQFLTTAMNVSQLPAPLFAEVAFAGRSNVGKSSLINSLARRTKLARTSSTPGCTRGLNLFRISLRGGAQIDFVDLPGYGFAQRSKSERASWGPMIENFLETRVGLRGVVLLVDVRRGLKEEELQMLDYLKHIKQKALVVATKVDRLPRSQQKTALVALANQAGVKAMPYSSHTGEGRDELWRMLCSMCSVKPAEKSAPPEKTSKQEP